MRFALIFGVCGLTLLGAAFLVGEAAWLGAWPGLDFVLLSAVYAADRPDWLGKRADGRLDPLRAFVFFPYFGFTWTLWHVFRRITPEPACHEVSPGVFLGRRPLGPDLPPSVTVVVDLTAEFPRPAGIRMLTVHQAPSLDARAPPDADLVRVIDAAAAAPAVYIHCAAGHGRSALVAALVLVRRGLAASLPDAVAILQRARPAVRLHRRQRETGERIAAAWSAQSGARLD